MAAIGKSTDRILTSSTPSKETQVKKGFETACRKSTDLFNGCKRWVIHLRESLPSIQIPSLQQLRDTAARALKVNALAQPALVTLGVATVGTVAYTMTYTNPKPDQKDSNPNGSSDPQIIQKSSTTTPGSDTPPIMPTQVTSDSGESTDPQPLPEFTPPSPTPHSIATPTQVPDSNGALLGTFSGIQSEKDSLKLEAKNSPAHAPIPPSDSSDSSSLLYGFVALLIAIVVGSVLYLKRKTQGLISIQNFVNTLSKETIRRWLDLYYKYLQNPNKLLDKTENGLNDTKDFLSHLSERAGMALQSVVNANHKFLNLCSRSVGPVPGSTPQSKIMVACLLKPSPLKDYPLLLTLRNRFVEADIRIHAENHSYYTNHKNDKAPPLQVWEVWENIALRALNHPIEFAKDQDHEEALNYLKIPALAEEEAALAEHLQKKAIDSSSSSSSDSSSASSSSPSSSSSSSSSADTSSSSSLSDTSSSSSSLSSNSPSSSSSSSSADTSSSSSLSGTSPSSSSSSSSYAGSNEKVSSSEDAAKGNAADTESVIGYEESQNLEKTFAETFEDQPFLLELAERFNDPRIREKGEQNQFYLDFEMIGEKTPQRVWKQLLLNIQSGKIYELKTPGRMFFEASCNSRRERKRLLKIFKFTE